jgi:hypothetical protein
MVTIDCSRSFPLNHRHFHSSFHTLHQGLHLLRRGQSVGDQTAVAVPIRSGLFAAASSLTHEVVNHAEEYVRDRVHTNGLENFWSLLKRGLRRTYVCVEPSSGLFYFSSTRNHWQNSRLCWWFKPLYNHHGQPNHQHNRGSNIDGQFQLRL